MTRAVITWPLPGVFDHHAIGIAHNHMKGSAHCVECAGPCQLTDPTQAAYTWLIRAIFEAEDHGVQKIPWYIEKFMREHGIDVDRFRKDAKG